MAIDGRLIYDEYQKRYARTSRRNTSGNIFTVKSETAGFSGKPA